MKSNYKDKVVVAMSGGVDSSTVAAMLHKQNYEVIGITLQLYSVNQSRTKGKACCAGQDIYDAKKAADQIGIPHYTLNYEDIFSERVIESFADSYVRGETPIPCIQCNQKVKFADLYSTAKKLGAKFLATGLYVRKQKIGDTYNLLRGIDSVKDQSYFMFTTKKEQLPFLEFPLGGMTKKETRQLAQDLCLSVSEKPESQDICFVPNGNYAEIVRKLRPESYSAGNIVLEDGSIIGKHDGIINYTIGQRKRIGISYPVPLYVTEIVPESNSVVVGPQSSLFAKNFSIKDVNWLIDSMVPEKEVICKVKFRSQQDPIPAKVVCAPENTALITLEHPYEKIAPGQACVMYDGDRVLGGGWVKK